VSSGPAVATRAELEAAMTRRHRYGTVVVVSTRETPMTDHEREAELQVLTSDECYRLLATQQIGRLGVNAEHYPLIFPVNYALEHDVIVLRMAPGTKLTAAQHANVAFEVDEIDQRTRSGWSVLVRGLAEEITPAHRAELVARTEGTGLTTWAPGEHGHWVRLIPQGISGRRIVPGRLPQPFEDAAYP
jgi:nitroimidazol reductase NimA-like FMN-containing flavoprotein (pyridoxamine 5'-phosphate oxidase superfamily)